MWQDKVCSNQASQTRGTVSLWTPYKVIQQREKHQELIRKQVSTSDRVSALSATALFTRKMDTRPDSSWHLLHYVHSWRDGEKKTTQNMGQDKNIGEIKKKKLCIEVYRVCLIFTLCAHPCFLRYVIKLTGKQKRPHHSTSDLFLPDSFTINRKTLPTVDMKIIHQTVV